MSATVSPAPHLSDAWRAEYLDALLSWFAQHQRDLPWRRTRDPYAVWISESMLQQTQVATVIDYYNRFLASFPDVAALAAASEQAVMAHWAGLGYYRRARQLHAAAQKIMSDHAGNFPKNLEDILQLPGIGRYTAGAIASIALGQPAPIVEANTQRLYARLMQLERPLQDASSLSQLWQFAQWQLDGSTRAARSSKKRDPGAINQAVMELGALICKPVSPQCMLCPLAKLCPTAQAGLQHRIPVPKPKRAFTPLHHVALIAHYRGRWLMRCNPPGGWWHGLWDFPRVDVTELCLSIASPGKRRSSTPVWNETAKNKILRLAHEQLLADNRSTAFVELRQPVLSLSHGVTRYRIAVDAVAAAVDRDCFQADPQWRWVSLQQAEQLPLTATAKKMLGKLSHLHMHDSGPGL